MIEAKVKYKKKTYTYDIPENWKECKLKHVLNLESLPEDNDLIDVLNCFMDLPKHIIENTTSNLWHPLFKVLEYVYNSPQWDKLKKQKTIHLNGKVLKIPQSLELETFGQWTLAIQAINKHKEKLTVIPELLTIYLQPKYDGKVALFRHDTIKELVLETPAFESIPIGLFFLQQVSETQKIWNDRFSQIPKDTESTNLYSQVRGEEVLGQFSDLITIDNLAKLYSYTHDDVFLLDLNFVNTLIYLHSQQDHIARKMSKLKEEMNKNLHK